MHEIHPAHSIASWKEILLHIGIITVGLLMALGIDAAENSSRKKEERGIRRAPPLPSPKLLHLLMRLSPRLLQAMPRN